MLSVVLWGSFCNVNMLYEICWTGHFWRFFLLKKIKIKNIENTKSILEILSILKNLTSYCFNIKKIIFKIINMDGSPHIIIGHQLRVESRTHMWEAWWPSYELKGPRYEELTMCMAACAWLALLTLLELKNHQNR